MLGYIGNTLLTVYATGKDLLHHALDYMKETVMTVPKTAEKIKESPNIQFILGNSLLINGVEFILPFVGYHAGKKVIAQVIGGLYPGYDDDNENVQMVSNAIDCTVYPILFFRLKLGNIVFNSVASVGAAIKLNDEFADRVQLYSHCQQCTPNYDRLTKQISLELHYVYGTTALSMINPYVNRLPHVGVPISVLLNAYWLGVVLFQYPLARNKVCAEHQISLLMQNRQRVLAHGLFLFMTLSVAIGIATLLTQDMVSNSITTTAVTNLLMPLFLVYIHQVELPLVQPSNVSLNTILDPVFVLWILSTYLTQVTCRFGLYAIQHNKNTQFFIFEKMKNASNLLSNSHLVRTITDVSTRVLIPPELKTLKAFSRSDAMRPYMILFLKNIENLLQKANTVNENPLTQLTYIALKMPVLHSFLLACSSLVANAQAGIPHDFTSALIRTLLALNINDNLPALHDAIKKTHGASKKHHERQQDNWMRFFNIGIQTPPSWFQEEGFVMLPQSAATAISGPIDSVSSFDDLDMVAEEMARPRLFNPEPESLDGIDEYDDCDQGTRHAHAN